jgi:hypothetical protein
VDIGIQQRRHWLPECQAASHTCRCALAETGETTGLHLYLRRFGLARPNKKMASKRNEAAFAAPRPKWELGKLLDSLDTSEPTGVCPVGLFFWRPAVFNPSRPMRVANDNTRVRECSISHFPLTLKISKRGNSLHPQMWEYREVRSDAVAKGLHQAAASLGFWSPCRYATARWA